MNTRLRRIHQLEAAFRSPEDFSTWTDAAIEAFLATGDPAETAVLRGLSDAELEALLHMSDAQVNAYVQARLSPTPAADNHNA